MTNFIGYTINDKTNEKSKVFDKMYSRKNRRSATSYSDRVAASILFITHVTEF